MFRQRTWLYEIDCHVFHLVNGKSLLRKAMSKLTHLGGATFTITSSLLIVFLTTGVVRKTAYAAILSLIMSHLIVTIIKRTLPRNRPYLVLPGAYVIDNPFRDHSFPSGHTTAIFSISIPFMLLFPSLILPLLMLSFLVGLSRIVLGLHYPSDVLAGAILGSITGWISVIIIGL